jgi:cytochrome P450
MDKKQCRMKTNKQIPKAYEGNIIDTFRVFTRDPLSFLKLYATNAEGISTFHIMHYRMIHITDPDMIRKVLTEHADRYTQSRDRDHMKLLFGNGLLTSADEHWQRQRPMIQPAFGKAQLEKLFSKIVSQIKQFTPPADQEIDIHQYSIDLINRIMADAIFSDVSDETLEIGSLLIDLKSDTLERLSNFALPLWIPTPGNIKYKKARQKIYDRINTLLQKRKHDRSHPGDILDSLIQAKDKSTGAGMNDEEIAEELLGIYAAAHEPVAIALTYSLHLIATHREVEAKINNEIVAVAPDQTITLDRYYRLNYIKLVVTETLRLYPSVWISGRRAIAEDDLNGYRIRKNDNIMYSPAIIHRDPAHWFEPDEFRPERFDTGHSHHPFSYVPFSGGPKYCLGSHLAMMILQLSIFELMSSYRLHTDVREISSNPFTTLKPIDKVMFRMSETGRPLNS